MDQNNRIIDDFLVKMPFQKIKVMAMLYRLEIENFHSVRDHQVLDLTIDAKVEDPDGRYAPIFEGAEARAPKVVTLYGANASGKTTVLRALQFLIWMIRDSVTATGFPGLERFNDTESANRPIRLAMELGGTLITSSEMLQRTQEGEQSLHGTYRYEIEIEVRDAAFVGISRESLRQRISGLGKWQRIFERDSECNVKVGKPFGISGYQHLVKTLGKSHSVLSSFAKFEHPIAKRYVDAARRALFQTESVHTVGDRETINFLQGQPSFLSKLNAELVRIDVGVEGLRFNDTPSGPQLMFKHSGLEQEMPWLLESHGTRAFIKMFPLIEYVLQNGGLVIVDELDTAIHPLVLPEIIRWFYSGSGRNNANAQIWLSCHSASLLENLNKEEIVICEKDRQGRTSVRSLMDVKVRRDENHYRKYLGGAYGGVPRIG